MTILNFQKRPVADNDEVSRGKHFLEIHSCVIESLRCKLRLSIKTIFLIRVNLETCPVLGANEDSFLPCHIVIHGKQHGIVNRRKIGPYLPKRSVTIANNSIMDFVNFN